MHQHSEKKRFLVSNPNLPQCNLRLLSLILSLITWGKKKKAIIPFRNDCRAEICTYLNFTHHSCLNIKQLGMEDYTGCFFLSLQTFAKFPCCLRVFSNFSEQFNWQTRIGIALSIPHTSGTAHRWTREPKGCFQFSDLDFKTVWLLQYSDPIIN